MTKKPTNQQIDRTILDFIRDAGYPISFGEIENRAYDTPRLGFSPFESRAAIWRLIQAGKVQMSNDLRVNISK